LSHLRQPPRLVSEFVCCLASSEQTLLYEENLYFMLLMPCIHLQTNQSTECLLHPSGAARCVLQVPNQTAHDKTRRSLLRRQRIRGQDEGKACLSGLVYPHLSYTLRVQQKFLVRTVSCLVCASQQVVNHVRCLQERRPGQVSNELKAALGMPSEGIPIPPPWLINMQRYGPPPSYPNLKVPG
jgi:hypothetical protein